MIDTTFNLDQELNAELNKRAHKRRNSLQHVTPYFEPAAATTTSTTTVPAAAPLSPSNNSQDGSNSLGYEIAPEIPAAPTSTSRLDAELHAEFLKRKSRVQRRRHSLQHATSNPTTFDEQDQAHEQVDYGYGTSESSPAAAATASTPTSNLPSPRRRRYSLQHTPHNEKEVTQLVITQLKDKLSHTYTGDQKVICSQGLGLSPASLHKRKISIVDDHEEDKHKLWESLKVTLPKKVYQGDQEIVEATGMSDTEDAVISAASKDRPRLNQKRRSARNSSNASNSKPLSPKQERDGEASPRRSKRQLSNGHRPRQHRRSSATGSSSTAHLNSNSSNHNSSRRRTKSRRVRHSVTQQDVLRVLGKVSSSRQSMKKSGSSNSLISLGKSNSSHSRKSLSIKKEVSFSTQKDQFIPRHDEKLDWNSPSLFASYWWTSTELEDIHDECQSLAELCRNNVAHVQALQTLNSSPEAPAQDMQQAARQLWKMPGARGLEPRILGDPAPVQHVQRVLALGRRESADPKALRKQAKSTSRRSVTLASALANLDVEAAAGAYLEKNSSSSTPRSSGGKKGRRHSMF